MCYHLAEKSCNMYNIVTHTSAKNIESFMFIVNFLIFLCAENIRITSLKLELVELKIIRYSNQNVDLNPCAIVFFFSQKVVFDNSTFHLVPLFFKH